MLYLIHPSFIGLFLPSSVVPGVCSIPAGSGARQDDAGGLSTSSMLPLKPFKLSCYLFTQKHLKNTQLWQDQKLTLSVVNTHSVCIKGILLRSSTSEFPFCKLLRKPNTLMPLIHIRRSVFVCVRCLVAVPSLIFDDCSPPGSERVWSAHQTPGEVQKGANRSNKSERCWFLLIVLHHGWKPGSDAEPNYDPTASWAAYTSQH